MVGGIPQQMRFIPKESSCQEKVRGKWGSMPGEVHAFKGSIVRKGTRHGRSMQKSMPRDFHIQGGTIVRGRSVIGTVHGREGSLAWEVHRRERTLAGEVMAGKSRPLSGFCSYCPSLVFVKLDI